MNTVVYARVSTEKQAEKELSIPAQLKAMTEYARQRGWEVVEEFIEPGASARTTERPVLKRMLARCQQQPKVDVVLVHKVDRLARDVHGHATINALLKQKGIRLASVVENVDDSITGSLVENIMASIAEFYSANLGEEVKKAQRVMVQGGSWPHQVPRGYRLDRDPQGKSIVVPDEALSPIIREAFDLYATGHFSLTDLADELLLRGVTSASGKRVPVSCIRTMLGNPFYTGRMRWNGAEYSAQHSGIISEGAFGRVQAVLRHRLRRQSERGRTRYLLRGLATCADCGYRVTAERHRRWQYYRCIRSIRRECDASASPIRDAEESLNSIYQRLLLPASLRERLLAEVASECSRREKRIKRDDDVLRHHRATLIAREIKLTETFVAGEVSAEAYRALGSKFRASISNLDAELTSQAHPTSELPGKVERLLAEASYLWDLHRVLDLPRQQQLLSLVFENLRLDRGQVVDYKLRPPFSDLFRAVGPKGPHNDSPPQFEQPPLGPAKIVQS